MLEVFVMISQHFSVIFLPPDDEEQNSTKVLLRMLLTFQGMVLGPFLLKNFITTFVYLCELADICNAANDKVNLTL